MKQTKQDLEDWYKISDPWSYESTHDDIVRKDRILSILDSYDNALDIGCGEGFVTKDIPAKNIFGLDISDNAALRLPPNVKRVIVPEMKYDLVMSTGTLYKQYDHETISKWIKEHSNRHVLVGGIKDWIIWSDFGNIVNEIEFKYRQYTHIIRLYEVVA